LGGDCHSFAGCRLSLDVPALAAVIDATTVNTSKIANITIILFILVLPKSILVRLFMPNTSFTRPSRYRGEGRVQA
jgi:hypothetical protein